jgi:dTDP-4-dehydrorhamnose reductase
MWWMEVVLIGATGLLGQDVSKSLLNRGISVLSPRRGDLDIADHAAVADYFDGVHADWVINCAAYVAVDDAETNAEIAFSVNADGARNIARAAEHMSARIFHISTDFVFDGGQTRPYTENDAVNPLGIYGESKLLGERYVQEECPSAMIARTAWLYGAGRTNFPVMILSAAQQGKELSIVSDRIGSPTYSADLAEAIYCAIEEDIPSGIYHMVNRGAVSWWEFCSHMLEAAGIGINLRKAKNSDYPTLAKRPMYSVLSTDKMQLAGIPPMPDWRSAAERFVAELRRRGSV